MKSKITKRNYNKAVDSALVAKQEERIDKILHAQICFGMSMGVSAFYADMFRHQIKDTGRMKLDLHLNHLNKAHQEMIKVTGVEKVEEADEARMDAEDVISEVINKLNKALLEGKEKQLLENIKYI